MNDLLEPRIEATASGEFSPSKSGVSCLKNRFNCSLRDYLKSCSDVNPFLHGRRAFANSAGRTFLSAALNFALELFLFVGKRRADPGNTAAVGGTPIKSEIDIEGRGQECPPYTFL